MSFSLFEVSNQIWYMGAPWSAMVTGSAWGLTEEETDTGKVVHSSSETANKGAILKAGGLLPVTNYHVSRFKTSVVQPRISGDYDYGYHPTAFTRWSGTLDTVYSASPSYGAVEEPNWTRLQTEAHARANQSAFDLLTNLAELPESVGMARNFLRNLEDRVRRIRNLRKVRASRSIEEFVSVFSSAWLEYRYGWRPLVGAARDLYEAVNLLGQPKETLPVSGRSSQNQTVVGAAGVSWANNNFGGYTDVTTCGTDRVARAFVTHLIRRESAAIGVNPMVTAWELVPYSFVIDWFTGIGDSLQAQFTPPGITDTIAGHSLKTVRATKSTRSHASVAATLTWTDGVYESRLEEYQRWWDPTSPPEFALMSQADRMSLAQWVDFALLAEGLLRRMF